MNKIDNASIENIIGGQGITPKDCFFAGVLEPYSLVGRWLGGLHAINSAVISAVGDYCQNAE